jgi:hypothetical protein
VGKSPGGEETSGGRTLAAGEAGKEVTIAGSLDRIIDGRPLRDAGGVFKIHNLAGCVGLD